MNFGGYKALLLDCDGTIVVNAEDVHKQCVSETIHDLHKKHNLPFDEENFSRVWTEQLGKGIANFYKTYAGVEVPELARAQGEPIDQQAARFEADYESRYKAGTHENMEVRKGLKELIADAKSHGVLVAVVSNARQSILEHTLKASGIEGFDLVLGSDVVKSYGYEMKPDGGPYQCACGLLGVRPADTIGFEDSISGYQSLQNAGVGAKVYCQNTLSDLFALKAAGRAIDTPDIVLTPQQSAQTAVAGFIGEHHRDVAPVRPAILPITRFPLTLNI